MLQQSANSKASPQLIHLNFKAFYFVINFFKYLVLGFIATEFFMITLILLFDTNLEPIFLKIVGQILNIPGSTFKLDKDDILLFFGRLSMISIVVGLILKKLKINFKIKRLWLIIACISVFTMAHVFAAIKTQLWLGMLLFGGVSLVLLVIVSFFNLVIKKIEKLETVAFSKINQKSSI